MAEGTRTMDIDVPSRGDSRRSRRWLIYINAYISMVSVCVFYSMNKMFVDIRNTFNSSRAETAAVISTVFGVGFGSGIFTGMTTRRFGVRKTAMIASSLSVVGMLTSFFATSVGFLIVSIGIFGGLGFGWLSLNCFALVGQYFQGRSAALAIFATAPVTSAMVFPYIIGFLLEKYGLRGTFLIITGILMQTFPLTALWISPDSSSSQFARRNTLQGVDNLAVFTIDSPGKVPSLELEGGTIVMIRYGENDKRENHRINNEIVEEAKSSPGKYSAVILEKRKQDKEWLSVVTLFKRKSFVAFIMSYLCASCSLRAFLNVLVDFVVDIGFTQDNASLCLLLINTFALPGRLCHGLLRQIPSAPVFLLTIISSIIGSVSLLVFAFLEDLTLLLISSCIFGIAFGLFAGSLSVTTNRIVSANELPNALGIVFTMAGIGNLAAGPTIGLMRDSFGSYKTALLTAVGPLVLAVVLLSLGERWHRTRRQPLCQSASVSYISKL